MLIHEKTDLASLIVDTDILDFGKLETNSTDLIRLSNVVENDVVKKIVDNEVVKNRSN